MASEKKFEEGIKSYRTRLEGELSTMLQNLPGLTDERNTISSLRIMVQYMRRSLDKINSYTHNIEMFVEKEYANAKDSNRPSEEPIEKEQFTHRYDDSR